MPVRVVRNSASALSAGLFPRSSSLDFAEITLSDSTWTNISSGFTAIMSLALQNKTDAQIKVRGNDPGSSVYKGMVVEIDEERSYNDIEDGFAVWAKVFPGEGAKTIFVEAMIE